MPLQNIPAELQKQLVVGRVVPFLGAGLGMPCGLPNWSGLLQKLATWSEDNGDDLSTIALIRHSISQGNLDAAAHALGQTIGSRLSEALRSILAPPNLKPTPLHSLLANVSWQMVLTTNFDNLLPESFANRLEPLTWQDNIRMGEVLRVGQPHLMMVHGWIERPDSIVLTPTAYRESFRSAAQRHYLTSLLSQHSFLFLGCSLRDPDIKYFLEELRYAFGPSRVPHFALLPANEVDELQLADMKDNDGIQVIPYTATAGHPEVEEFVRRLIDVLPTTFLYDPLVKVSGLQVAKSLAANTTPSEYLVQFRNTCDEIAASGLLRTAWSALHTELKCTMQASVEVRLRTSMRLAQMMREDQVFDFAVRILQEYAKFLDDPAMPDDLRLQFEMLRFRSFLDEYCLAEARDVCTRAAAHGAPTTQLEEMRSGLMIAEFLHAGQAPESATQSTQAFIAYLEARAIQGDIELVLKELDIAATIRCAEGNIEECVQLRNKRAQLLYADCRNEDAWNEFEQGVKPSEQFLPMEQRAQLQHNQVFAGFILGKQPLDNTLHAGRDLHNSNRAETAHTEQLLSAESASREQKHYDSLPPLWRELCRANAELSWSARNIAHSRLAWEVFAAGWIPVAVHHAIRGNNEACLQRLAEFLAGERNSDLTASVVDYVLTNCTLARHASTGCTLLVAMIDILPEKQMPAIVHWLLRAATKPISNHDGERCVIVAWDALRAIAHRLPISQASAVLQVARNHPFLSTPRFGRQAVLKAIDALIAHGAGDSLRELADQLLPIATTARWDGDYQEIVRVLARIAQRNVEARELLRTALFDPSATAIDVRLAKYATSFGHVFSDERIFDVITRIERCLPFQVHAGETPAPPFQLSSYGVHSSKSANETIQIQVFGGASELDCVSAHKSQVPITTLGPLVTVVLRLIANPFNSRQNRIMLINFLVEVREHVDRAHVEEAYRCLRPYATGHAEASPAEPPQTTTTDRMRWNTDSPTEEQAFALRAMTLLANSHPENVDPELPEMILNGLFHQDSAVRQYACVCAAELPSASGDLEFPLLTATLDSDSQVAGAALHAATRLLDRGLLYPHIPLLIAIATRTSSAEKPIVRALAAELTVALTKLSITKEQRPVLARVRAALEEDTSHQVRSAIGKGGLDDGL